MQPDKSGALAGPASLVSSSRMIQMHGWSCMVSCCSLAVACREPGLQDLVAWVLDPAVLSTD